MSYDRNKMKPGYKGKFFIQSHDAKKAGKHWDIRFEFPVESLENSLKHYDGKRNPMTNEPFKDFPDKSGTVLRSFVNKKREIPTKNNKVYLIETEDHPITYGSWEGTIPEGQYGAGEVKAYDKGTYDLLEREKDKKYVMKIKGDKINGTYALIKYKDGFLWVKANEKIASSIDYVRPSMSPQLWELILGTPRLRPEVRNDILNRFFGSLEKNGLKSPWKWLKGLVMTGSATCTNYKETGDVDIDVLYDPRLLSKELECKMTYKQINDFLKNIIYENNKKRVADTSFYYSFMVIEEGDKPAGDGLYDIIRQEWIKGPVILPETFDPDKAFYKQRLVAVQIAKKIDDLILGVIMAIEDLRKLDMYIKRYGGKLEKKIALLFELKILADSLAIAQVWLWDLQRNAKKAKDGPQYLVYDYSLNWDRRMILFKYLARYGYLKPIKLCLERLEDDSYKKMMEKMFPIEPENIEF